MLVWSSWRKSEFSGTFKQSCIKGLSICVLSYSLRYNGSVSKRTYVCLQTYHPAEENLRDKIQGSRTDSSCPNPANLLGEVFDNCSSWLVCQSVLELKLLSTNLAKPMGTQHHDRSIHDSICFCSNPLITIIKPSCQFYRTQQPPQQKGNCDSAYKRYFLIKKKVRWELFQIWEYRTNFC